MNQYELTVATQSADVRPEQQLGRDDRIAAALKAIKAELYRLNFEQLCNKWRLRRKRHDRAIKRPRSPGQIRRS